MHNPSQTLDLNKPPILFFFKNASSLTRMKIDQSANKITKFLILMENLEKIPLKMMMIMMIMIVKNLIYNESLITCESDISLTF